VLFRSVTGKTADYWRVEIDNGRPAFVAMNAARTASGGGGGALEPNWMVSPPLLTVTAPALETSDGRMRLHGAVRDDHKVGDVYVVVQNRTAKVDFKKVFYRSNRNSQDPRKMEFDVDIPLWPGENYVHVFARENAQVQSRQTLVVLRGKPTQVAHPAASAAQ